MVVVDKRDANSVMVGPASVSVTFWKTVVVLSSGSSVTLWDRITVVVAKIEAKSVTVGPCSVMVLSVGSRVMLKVSVGPCSVIVVRMGDTVTVGPDSVIVLSLR